MAYAVKNGLFLAGNIHLRFAYCTNVLNIGQPNGENWKQTWLLYRNLEYETVWQEFVSIWLLQTESWLTSNVIFLKVSTTISITVPSFFGIRDLNYQVRVCSAGPLCLYVAWFELIYEKISFFCVLRWYVLSLFVLWFLQNLVGFLWITFQRQKIIDFFPNFKMQLKFFQCIRHFSNVTAIFGSCNRR